MYNIRLAGRPDIDLDISLNVVAVNNEKEVGDKMENGKLNSPHVVLRKVC